MRFTEALGCGIKKKNSSAKNEIPPLKLFIKSVLETPAPNNTGRILPLFFIVHWNSAEDAIWFGYRRQRNQVDTDYYGESTKDDQSQSVANSVFIWVGWDYIQVLRTHSSKCLG